MSSLADFARTTTNPDVKPLQTQGGASSSSTSVMSLVDVARQQKEKGTKPITLLDVARTVEPSGMEKTGQPSLADIARDVNEEERLRMDSAITMVAREVKEEQRRNREDIMKAAAVEVHEQLAPRAAQNSSVPTPPSDKDSRKQSQADAPVPKTIEVEESGYSSFEDEDVPKRETQRNARAKSNDKSNEDNQSDAELGPEKTEASDSLESKQYLRAVHRGDLRCIQDLSGENTELNANTADQHGWSALHWATAQGHTRILSYLLSLKPRINAVEHLNGWTALHVAVTRDSVGCVKKLLRAGANLQLRDRYDDTVFDIARAIKGKRGERMLRVLEEHRTTRAS